MSATPAFAGIQKGADAIGLGWLTRAIGYLLIGIVGVILSPLLIGYYLSPYKLSQDKFYFDEIYNVLFVKPLECLGDAFYAIDRGIVDGAVNGFGKLALGVGGGLRKLQGGLVPFYGMAMVFAALLFIAVRVLWAR